MDMNTRTVYYSCHDENQENEWWRSICDVMFCFMSNCTFWLLSTVIWSTSRRMKSNSVWKIIAKTFWAIIYLSFTGKSSQCFLWFSNSGFSFVWNTFGSLYTYLSYRNTSSYLLCPSLYFAGCDCHIFAVGPCLWVGWSQTSMAQLFLSGLCLAGGTCCHFAWFPGTMQLLLQGLNLLLLLAQAVNIGKLHYNSKTWNISSFKWIQ